jgi:hypothetical protein
MPKSHHNINPLADDGLVCTRTILAPTGPLPATITDPIAYLIRRKFYRRETGLECFRTDRLVGMAPQAEREAVEAYRSELQARRPEKVSALVEAELAREASEEEPQAQQADRDRFFNLPGANADLAWGRTMIWSLEGAVALSFGKDPDVVTWERVKPHLQFSSFATEYLRIRELAYAARDSGLLHDIVQPYVFIAWAKRAGIPFPAELGAAVVENDLEMVDWQAMYYVLDHSSDAREQEDRAIKEQRRATIDELTHRCVDLANQLAAAKSTLRTEPAKATEIGTRERDTLLKLVIGMAVKGYGYDPDQQRSGTVGEIVSDLELVGMALDADTVRKWLRQAADLLSRKQPE